MPKDFSAPGGHQTVARVPAVINRGQARKGLPHQSNRPFYLKWHPSRFYFDAATNEWFPLLGTIVLDEGLSGVAKDGDDTLAHVQATKRGWFVLPLDCVPPNTPDGQYLHAYPCQDGGIYYCTAWESPNHEGGKVASPPTLTDTDGYRDFLRWLMAEGYVRPASDNAKNAAIAMDRVRVQELAKRAGKSPLLQPEYDAAMARHMAMSGHTLEEAPDPEPSAPVERVPVALPKTPKGGAA